MKWKSKLAIAIILDAIDLFLGLLGLGLNLIIPGIAITLNNIRGVIYDLITTPIVVSLFGLKGLGYFAEVVIPDEIDMLIPTATIIAVLYKGDKK